MLQYSKGSKEHGIVANSYATVVKTQSVENLITVRREDGQQLTYDREAAQRHQCLPANRTGVRCGRTHPVHRDRPRTWHRNRNLATITKIEGTQIGVKMDGEKGRELTVDAARMRHIDHGYAVTSHSSQGLTTRENSSST